MRYVLIVLTHGQSETLERTLASFYEMVTPSPHESVLITDGGAQVPVEVWDDVRVSLGPKQRGFCAAAQAGWLEAADSFSEHCFWLEHDFLFTKPVDLEQLAAPLEDPYLAQMALVREPVNGPEWDAGGYIPLRGHDRFTDMGGWLRHGEFWTTNPSLFRTDLARAHEWPGPPGCEEAFGNMLLAEGLSFGLWGDGTPQVKHVGVRDGIGY